MTTPAEKRKATKKRNNWLLDEHKRLIVNLKESEVTPEELKKYQKSFKDFKHWASRWSPERLSK
jgi:hypothetical protein